MERSTWNEFCAPVDKGVVWKRYQSNGNAYSYGAAVKFANVIGMDLSGKKQYSSHHTIDYSIKGSNPKKLCGKGLLHDLVTDSVRPPGWRLRP